MTPLLNREELAALGFQLVVCPLTALYASAKIMWEMFGLIKSSGTTRDALDRLLSFEDFHDVIGLHDYYKLDDRYRAPGQPE